MFLFLDEMNPDMFILRTKFGTLPHYSRKGTYVISDEKRRQVKLLCEYFSCDFANGLKVYDKWLLGKPVYVRIKNSTNEYVFVADSDIVNISSTTAM